MKETHPPFLRKGQNRILILSDDPELGYAMKNDLRRLGLEVDVNTGTHWHPESPKSPPYDGIILDLDTRESNRFHVFRDLYAAYPHIPIVVVGAENMHYDFLFAFIGGAKDFLVKPVDSVCLKRLCLRLFL